MKRIFLAVITWLFLVILAPVLAFSMLAPWAMKDIPVWWSAIVAVATVVGGSISAWAYLESRN